MLILDNLTIKQLEDTCLIVDNRFVVVVNTQENKLTCSLMILKSNAPKDCVLKQFSSFINHYSRCKWVQWLTYLDKVVAKQSVYGICKGERKQKIESRTHYFFLTFSIYKLNDCLLCIHACDFLCNGFKSC